MLKNISTNIIRLDISVDFSEEWFTSQLEIIDVAFRTEVEKRTTENEQLLIQVVRSLADAIDEKDGYTNGRSGRVAAYTRKIARWYGYKEEECES